MTNPVRKISHIFVIQNLPAGQSPTGYDLYNDVIRRRIDYIQAADIKMTHHFFDTKDKSTFVDAIKYIEANAKYFTGGVLIHFETHGSENRDGLVLANGTLISWSELVAMFRPINILTCNKLFISMATCYGRYLYLGINPHSNEKSPYQAYISASDKVMPENVLEKFSHLFEILIDTGDLIHAYLEHEKMDSPFFYKDSLKSLEDVLKLKRKELETDPEYRKNILDHPEIHRQLEEGLINQQTLDGILKIAFRATFIKLLETFNFKDYD